MESKNISTLKTKSLAVIAPINSGDGVAIFTKNFFKFYENTFKQVFYLGQKTLTDRTSKDENNVVRTWDYSEKDFSETLKFIKENSIDIVHIQYHSASYYNPQVLSKLIVNLKRLNVKIFINLHAVKSNTFDFVESVPDLKSADLVIVHNKFDYDHAKTKISNIILMHLPINNFKFRSKNNLKTSLGLESAYPIIASHGIFNANKNIDKIIEAIKILKLDYPNILFLSVNAVSLNNFPSIGEFEKAKKLTSDNKLDNNVRFFTDFLDYTSVQILLQSSDINVLNYSFVGESGSAAVRECILSLNPTIVTDIPTFSEFENEVYKIADTNPTTIADAIRYLLSNNEKVMSLKDSAEKFIKNNSFKVKSEEFVKYYI